MVLTGTWIFLIFPSWGWCSNPKSIIFQGGRNHQQPVITSYATSPSEYVHQKNLRCHGFSSLPCGFHRSSAYLWLSHECVPCFISWNHLKPYTTTYKPYKTIQFTIVSSPLINTNHDLHWFTRYMFHSWKSPLIH